MKLSICFALLGSTILSLAETSMAPDKVHVTPDLVSEHRDPEKSPKEVVVKTLKMTLNNHTNEDIKSATVRVIFYARDLTKDSTIVEKTLEKTVILPARKELSITMDSVTFNYTPDHGSTVKGRRGKVTSKRVPASGHRYAGYSVQLIEAGKVVGWSSSGQQFDPSAK
jgi:hypothetical protein